MAKPNALFTNLEEFDKKVNFNAKLDLDNRDTTIIALLQNNPNISQEEIATKIKLSQPSVGARIKKLQQKGILHTVNGVNFRVVDLQLAKIDVTSTDTEAVIAEFKDCPFFINALVTSGKFNICLFFTATDLKRLEAIVNTHLRSNPKVKDVELNIVIKTSNDFILPLNINYDNEAQAKCVSKCPDCF